MKIDLHSHSTASDGTLPPRELIREAARQGVAVLALTDHDTTAGLEEAAGEAEGHALELLAGIELSVCEDAGRLQCHILGLGIDPSSPALLACTGRLRAARRERIAAMIAHLRRLGVPIECAPEELAEDGASVGRPHLARHLVALGQCRTAQQAFDRYIGRGKPAFEPPAALGAREAIELIHGAGGVASLAHPLRSVGADAPGGAASFIGRFARLDLDAIEVQHPAQTRGQRRRLSRIARELGLLETGGSDFHGPVGGDIRLGRGRGDVRLSKACYRVLCERLERRRSAPPAA